VEPNWAPYIARLALHEADVAENKKIRLLRELARNPGFAAQCYLPGIDNHPYLSSFTAEAVRWFICICGAPNYVMDCGRPTTASLCANCRVALAEIQHHPRAGVRQATPADFQPPKGIATSRVPSPAPAFTVRDKPAVVTRFCLLLNSLALMTAALDPKTSDAAIVQILRTRRSNPTLRQNQEQMPQEGENRLSLIRFLANQIQAHLRLLNQLLVTDRPHLTQPDQFRVGHFLLHRLLNFQQPALNVDPRQFAVGPQPRDAFENALYQLLSQQVHLELELDRMTEQSNEASRVFRRSLSNNQTSFWPYACLVSSNRASIQLFLARDDHLRQRYPFLNLLLDENWSNKLDALRHLGNAVRFIALVRTVLQGNITLDEANRMIIGDGLEKMAEVVEQKAVLLDRGRTVSSREHVQQLFHGFKSLWDRFSQLPNLEHKTFIDHFECQQVDLNIRPKTILEETAPLILILAGTDLPETT